MADTPLYQRPSEPTEDRVADLLDRMTVDEKLGQLVGGWAGQLDEYADLEDAEAMIEDDGIGDVSPFGWSGAVAHGIDDVVEAANRLQRVAVEETRLGIPIQIPVDAVHGHAYVSEATVFPNGLGLAATWDPDLAERVARVTATEMRATGATQNYAPTVDLARDPRWGRTFETLGESPYLVADLAAAQVRGLQEGEDQVLATAKHFPAYGQPARGEDTSVVSVSEYELLRMFLPPAEAAVQAGVGSVMPSYNAIDGVPSHASERRLTGLLREELGFEGTVVSDWNGVDQLHREHKVAADAVEAEKLTRDAGLDVASVGGPDHVAALQTLFEEGRLSEDRIDESVRRVLRAKFELGLFEDPYVDPDEAAATVGREGHRELAREVARESITLLENDGLLPLDPADDVLVTGPNADDLVRQRGGWTAYDGDLRGTTLLEGIEAASEGTVTHEEGVGIVDPIDIDAAVAAAEDADVAVVALGEHWYLHEFVGEPEQTDLGEFPSRLSLDLPDAQRELVQAIHETGTPTVGVLVTGRPHTVTWMAEHLPALLMAYFPGTEGGRAIADVLYGAEPGGRLPISVPKSEGHLPSYFNYFPHPHPIGPETHPDSYDPLYEFGHGLSYAAFAYRDLTAPDEIAAGESATVEVTVENVGDRAGEDVVPLFVEDVLSSRVTPVRELRGYERCALEAGESATVELTLTPEDLAMVDPDGERRVEPGTFALSVGDLEADLEVTR